MGTHTSPSPALRATEGAPLRPPALVLTHSSRLRARVHMGLRTGGAHRVLGGVRVASGWDHLRDLSTRFPGSPAFVDPTVPSSDSSHDPVRWFRRVCPESPVIAYAKTTAAELHTLSAPMVPLATLRYRTDDQLTTIGAIALKYADADAVRGWTLGRRVDPLSDKFVPAPSTVAVDAARAVPLPISTPRWPGWNASMARSRSTRLRSSISSQTEANRWPASPTTSGTWRALSLE